MPINMNEFAQQIYAALQQIPEGSVVTYGDLARISGNPGYARQVGLILKMLPKDSRLPWHRVVNGRGELSLRGDAFERQKKALESEGIFLNEYQILKFKLRRWP